MKPYADRLQAGRELGVQVLARFGNELRQPLVLGLPRGGVPVAAGIAAALQAPLDVIVVRKIGFVGHEELAMGAIASVAGIIEVVANEGVLGERRGRAGQEFAQVAAAERVELNRRDRLYRGDRAPLDVHGRTLIVTDDGVATGASMRAAIAALRHETPERIIIAVPVCLRSARPVLEEICDDLVCPWAPADFMAVGQAYRRFDQTSDEEVRAILDAGSAANR